MMNFTKGTWRQTKEAGKGQLSSVSDLVNRTLAQHGLAPQAGGTPNLSDILAHLRSASAAPVVPEGASFAEDSFSCAAGTRRFRTYVPASAKKGATGLVLMLHGCTQSPEDFAAGTGMNALADKQGFIVVYPHQTRGDNAQSCWNWFSRGDQQRDKGEPSILSGITRHVMSQHNVPTDQVFVAGLSAGAAMAVILGKNYPDLFHGVGAHSGLPAGAAKDVPSAFAAMAGQGINVTPEGTPVRTIVFHGSADTTVHPSNGDRIVQHALDPRQPQSLQNEEKGNAQGRSFRRCTVYAPNGAVAVEHWIIEGMGHAWSGGKPEGSYTDEQGPDASAEMIRFFRDV
ncbi:PHB depolymerase family esterase [Paracoccus sp. JM45]|uniref:extracellular catalytic domain type 1 short-chain-length polyhydroxyalkanoate depolymerase n=1 Tax=Paracoccus sp. JM45 TaxID=2283626 RepID=UPI000E6C5719|nr:PHB depolymerase family esterase [Paracoccus sp. JM45]RJE78730.1 esterase [Paracoccus sp. JM45]